MSRLVLKGHATRGKEVINLLEMLGANRLGYKDTFVGFYYYIECGAIHSSDEYPTYATIFTLEEFLEKYPFKVGDKVKAWVNGYSGVFNIQDITWDSIAKAVKYRIHDYWHSVENLQPLKEETMEDKDMSEHTSEINLNHPCFDGCDKIELIIPDNWKFEQRGNKMFGVRKYPRYPKTYQECCDILRIETNRTIEHDNCLGYRNITLYDINLLTQLRYFRKLLICRDAYWKIAGEQMGLDKPWKPEWTIYKHKFCLGTDKDKVIEECVTTGNRILAFPTKEMRDAFYDAFEELINEVKELL